jgi:hypothetical protein
MAPLPEASATGMGLNLLVFRPLTHVYQTDASQHGLGGYGNTGRVWQLAIPADLLGRAHINLLKYMGTVIGPWLDHLDGNLSKEASVLSQGDNRTATGWCHKSNFESVHCPAHLKVLVNLDCCNSKHDSNWSMNGLQGIQKPLWTRCLVIIT